MVLSTRDVSKILRIKTRSVINAINDCRLEARKIDGKWQIDDRDLEVYIKSKYKRSNRYTELSGLNPGEILLSDVCCRYGLTKQALYYAVYRQYIPCIRRDGRLLTTEIGVKNYLINHTDGRRKNGVRANRDHKR